MAWPKDPSGEWYQFDGEILIPVNPASGWRSSHLRPNGGMAQASPRWKRATPDCRRLSTPPSTTRCWPTTTRPPARRHGRSSPRPVTPRREPTGSTSPSTKAARRRRHHHADHRLGLRHCRLQEDPSGQRRGKRIRVHQPEGRRAALPGDDQQHRQRQPNSTLAVVSIAAGTYDFDYRVEVEAQTIVTPTGANCAVDLVARLNGEAGGRYRPVLRNRRGQGAAEHRRRLSGRERRRMGQCVGRKWLHRSCAHRTAVRL